MDMRVQVKATSLVLSPLLRERVSWCLTHPLFPEVTVEAEQL